MHGVEVGELRLPPGASVSLVVREGETHGARARAPCCGTATTCSSSPRARRATPTEERLRRCRTAGGWPSGSATRARRPDKSSAGSGRRRAAEGRLDLGRRLDRLRSRSDVKDSPTTTTMPRPEARRPPRSWTTVAWPNCRATSRDGRVLAGRVGPDLDAARARPGRVADVAADEAAVLEQLQGRPGQPDAVAAVEDADGDLVAEDRPCRSATVVSEHSGGGSVVGQRRGQLPATPTAPATTSSPAQHEQGEGRRDAIAHQAATSWTRACRTLRWCSAARSARCRPSSR